MSKRTQITILFITMIIIFITFGWSYKVYSNYDCYEYDLVNTTKDEEIRDTLDKNESSVYNINNEVNDNDSVKNVSRSLEINRSQIDLYNYNGNTGLLRNEANENIEIYIKNIEEVLDITNNYRKEVGLNELTLDKRLCEAASVRALEMAYTNNLSHIRPDGAKCFVVLKDLEINYMSAAENIADGYIDSKSVCDAWKNSESHYENIVCKKYNKIGIGLAQSADGRYYWAQIFSN